MPKLETRTCRSLTSPPTSSPRATAADDIEHGAGLVGEGAGQRHNPGLLVLVAPKTSPGPVSFADKLGVHLARVPPGGFVFTRRGSGQPLRSAA